MKMIEHSTSQTRNAGAGYVSRTDYVYHTGRLKREESMHLNRTENDNGAHARDAIIITNGNQNLLLITYAVFRTLQTYRVHWNDLG